MCACMYMRQYSICDCTCTCLNQKYDYSLQIPTNFNVIKTKKSKKKRIPQIHTVAQRKKEHMDDSDIHTFRQTVFAECNRQMTGSWHLCRRAIWTCQRTVKHQLREGLARWSWYKNSQNQLREELVKSSWLKIVKMTVLTENCAPENSQFWCLTVDSTDIQQRIGVVDCTYEAGGDFVTKSKRSQNSNLFLSPSSITACSARVRVCFGQKYSRLTSSNVLDSVKSIRVWLVRMFLIRSKIFAFD